MPPWRLLLLLVWLSISTGIAGQQADSCKWTLAGTLIDDHDGTPLEYATVLVLETGKGVVADSLGRFSMTGLCTRMYTLQFSHIGCETKTRMIRIDGDDDITLRLEHHMEIIQEIQVTARKISEAGSVARATLSSDELVQLQGQVLGESMRELPGVTAIQTGPGIFKPVIHGLHSNRVLILTNGIRLESQQWGLDHAPEIDPFLATDISVVKGTAAVQYGADAVAGVILIEHDSLPHSRQFGGKVALHGMTNGWQGGASAMLQRGFSSGIGIRWHGTLKRSGDKRAPDYNLTNTGISEANTSVAIGYRRGLDNLELSYNLFSTTIGILRSAHIGNLTDLEDALERGEPFVIEDFSYRINNPKQEVIHHKVKLAGQKYFETAGMLSGHYALQINRRSEYDIRRGGRDDIPALDLDLLSQTGLLQFSHNELWNAIRGNVSLHWNYQQNSNVPGTGVRPLIPNYTSYSPGISIVEKWLGSNLEVEAGFRYEFDFLRVKRFDRNNILRKPEFRFQNFSTSLGARWDVNANLAFTGNFGTTNRAPNVNELFSEGLHHGAAAIEEGDSTLTPEKALKLVLGSEMRYRVFEGRATLYWQLIEDFIYLRPDGEPRLTIRGAFPVFRYVQNDARLWGTDLAARVHVLHAFDVTGKYSMVRAENLDEGEPLIFMPADRLQFGTEWLQPSGRWNAGLTIEHVFEQTRAPEGLDYAPPPPAYTLINVNGGATFDLSGNALTLNLTIRNLLNTRYREYLNRLRYFADDIGRNIEIRIQYEF